MDSSSGQHHHQVQEMGGSQTLESMLGCTGKSGVGQQQVEKKGRPADMQAIKCPRCDSSNTKFCYYNNYSLSQPRYFCKSCRRYWTKGGTLRNVPVGGGCRKNKRSSSSSTTTTSSTSTTSSKNPPSLPPALTNANNPYDIHSNNDLSLAIARLQRQTAAAASSFDDHDHFSIWGNNNNQHQHHHLHLGAGGGGFLENPQSLYYGMNSSGLEMGMGMGGAQEIMGGGIPFEDFSPVKQEGVGRVLWGFPWHHNTAAAGDDHHHHHHHALINAANAPADLDSTTRSLINWNNGNWHGLLNTPLM